MAEDIKVDLELDLKGLLCPLPMVRVSQNIRKQNSESYITDTGRQARGC
jgi:TusA-related sulfurtransferase